MFRLAHEFLFSKKAVFWRDAKHIVLLVILSLMLIDICIYTGMVEGGVNTVRWSRPLRPLLIVNIPEGEVFPSLVTQHFMIKISSQEDKSDEHFVTSGEQSQRYPPSSSSSSWSSSSLP